MKKPKLYNVLHFFSYMKLIWKDEREKIISTFKNYKTNIQYDVILLLINIFENVIPQVFFLFN